MTVTEVLKAISSCFGLREPSVDRQLVLNINFLQSQPRL